MSKVVKNHLFHDIHLQQIWLLPVLDVSAASGKSEDILLEAEHSLSIV